MEKLELVEFEEFKNQFVLKAILGTHCLGHAVYHTYENTLYLTWIETQPEYRGQGVAFRLLDYLAEKAVEQCWSLAIIVIDEYTINDFYWRWFVRRTQTQETQAALLRSKFDSLLNQGDTPSLLFTPEDLRWTVES